ncbi:MAG: hypothetical protein PF588_05885 [Candidatus Kapabacteria bacterium]|jgi:hypothetical protein|nr:hypothetical protein [Candidatus Kapabacteria bacterium]
MRKLTKIIISFLLSASLLVSTIGINLSIHTCKAAGRTDVSVNFLQANADADDPCPKCAATETALCCETEIVESDCCSKHNPPQPKPEIKKDRCCDEFSKLIQSQYDIETISNISIPVTYSFISIESPILESVESAPDNADIVLSQYSGIPPPYSSTYLRYISSIRE